MTYHYSTNNSYLSAEMGPYPLFDLKTLMIDHGWTVTRSSNGLTAFGTADYILTATDLTSRYSWMVLQSADGAGGREWLFGMDNDTDTHEWYVGYSASAGFTGGTLMVMPTATDEAFLLNYQASGATRDLFPLYDNCFCHMMVDDASDAFYMITVVQSNHCICGCIAGDPLTETHALDTDPYVAMAQYYDEDDNFACTTGPWGRETSTTYTRGWYNYPSGSAEQIYALGLRQGITGYWVFPASATGGYGGVSVYDGSDETFPVIWGRSSYSGSPCGVKGTSTLFRNVSTQRAGCDLLTVGSNKQIMTGTVYGFNVSLPWDPTATPL